MVREIKTNFQRINKADYCGCRSEMVVVGEMAHSGTEGVVCRRQKPRGLTACRQGSIGGDFRVSRLGDWISVASCEGTDFGRSRWGRVTPQVPNNLLYALGKAYGGEMCCFISINE